MAISAGRRWMVNRRPACPRPRSGVLANAEFNAPLPPTPPSHVSSSSIWFNVDFTGVVWTVTPSHGRSPGLSNGSLFLNIALHNNALPYTAKASLCQLIFAFRFVLYFIFQQIVSNGTEYSSLYCIVSNIRNCEKPLTILLGWIMFCPDITGNGWLGVKKQLPTYLPTCLPAYLPNYLPTPTYLSTRLFSYACWPCSHNGWRSARRCLYPLLIITHSRPQQSYADTVIWVNLLSRRKSWNGHYISLFSSSVSLFMGLSQCLSEYWFFGGCCCCCRRFSPWYDPLRLTYGRKTLSIYLVVVLQASNLYFKFCFFACLCLDGGGGRSR